MKLIVLYGESNKGKTTTLLNVHKKLKELDVLDIDCKKEFDAHKRYKRQIDIRDVLVINNEQYVQKNTNVAKMLCQLSYDDFSKEGNAIDKIKVWHRDIQKDDKLQNCEDFIRKKYFDSKTFKSVGIVTEGDFGFESHSKGRNLYINIKEIEFCDVVICACTKGKKRVNVEDCVKKFSEEHKVTPCIVTQCNEDIILACLSNSILSNQK